MSAPRNERRATHATRDAQLKALGITRATRRALRRKALHKAVLAPRTVLDVLHDDSQSKA